uniref:Ubiquitin carboxyl-terminal hydrolase n=1 Tax=Kalanchoe fedtschenkoi TaxID=63787 RepID=A0A7N0UTL1_KALFE
MGKKAKKKVRTPQRDKLTGATTPDAAFDSVATPTETSADVAHVVKERKQCIHLEKGVNLAELLTKDWSVGSVLCEDCRENASDRRGNRGKGKAGKKKGHGKESNTDAKAIWVCLQCGHRACGGVGLPTIPQSHAVRHARQARHPLAIHYDNSHLRWCFICSTLIPVEKFEEGGGHEDVISDAVKIIQNQSSNEASGNIEDIMLRVESVKTVLGDNSDKSGKGYYVVRGLMNLGNTCFFNSVVQNLLAMDKLRGYFSRLDGSYGPLTISLKKLFAETSLDTGQKSAVNPKSFFGCVCAKAPQFRGYLQQDSHELLRCLLDGLSMEELSLRKQIKTIHENDVPPNPDPTFVDVAFGGRVSSTVCCLECGHTSTVYEPFLDLSLPVPTKKPPKKTQNAPVVKRTKVPVPPKRVTKVRAKPKKDLDGDPTITKVVSSCESSQEASSNVENIATSPMRLDGFDRSPVDHHPHLQCSLLNGKAADSSSSDCPRLDVIDLSTVPNGEVLGVQQDMKEDDMSWLEYLDSETVSVGHDINIEDFDAFTSIDSGCRNDRTLHNTSNTGPTVSESFNERTFSLSSNAFHDEVPVVIQDCEVLLLPYKESLPNMAVMEGQASSTLIAQEEDASDFNGFGDLFNEPETSVMAVGPSTRPDSESDMKDSGTTISFCSESDPDEVDDTSPVSIESCLAYFTKQELLLKEQGWYCEKCSKIVQCYKSKPELNHVINGLKIQSNYHEAGMHITASGSEDSSLSFIRGGHLTNGESIENGVTNFAIHIENIFDEKNELRDVLDSVNSLNVNMATDTDHALNEILSPISLNSSAIFSDPVCANAPSLASTIGEVPGNISGVARKNELQENEVKESSSSKLTRNATKRLLIEKAPPILTIHLKRFSQDARGRLSKLNGHVAFRETIDLRPYMIPRFTDGDKYIYRLVGIVEHLGTMRGGHYIAYIRGGEKNVWYHASDAYVREASFEEVLRCEAYILFYNKIE